MSILGENSSFSVGLSNFVSDKKEYDSISSQLSRYVTKNWSMVNGTSPSVTQSGQDNLLGGLIVPLYGIIFVLSVVGNSLVLITLARNKRMRTVTNVYLLNLAVSDLLLGVFCMPFTLLGQMLKNFVFGLTMCKLIPYFQAVSVSVGVWTLVAISLERYFAICRPFKSRRWQTQFHAYKMIAVVWIASLIWNAPILLVSRLKNIRGGRRKCREEWPSVGAERAYNLFLDGTLLLVPLVVMSLAYSLIAIKLWRGLKREIRQSSSCQQRLERSSPASTVRGASCNKREHVNVNTTVVFNACNSTPKLHQEYSNYHGTSIEVSNKKLRVPRTKFSTVFVGKYGASSTSRNARTPALSPPPPSLPTSSSSSSLRNTTNGQSYLTKDAKNLQDSTACPLSRQHVVRSNYIGKSIEAKKKVISMLFVIVLEFFVCWAPLHVINTWYLFAPELVYSVVGITGISLVQLLAYISSCCNPITYCFMNRKFRQAFLGVFHCHRCWRVACRNGNVAISARKNVAQIDNSEVSANESTLYAGKTSLLTKTEVVRLLEEEDCL